MNKTIKLTSLLLFISIINISCSQVITNRFNLGKAYNLYEKGKNEDDDKALLEITKTYNDIINQKIYAQERLASVYRTLGERSLVKEQYGYAAKYFSEALKIIPNSPYLRYGLGISYVNLAESSDDNTQREDFIDKAEKNIKFAISKDAKNPNYYAALASLKNSQEKKYEEALELINKSVELAPNNTDYLFILANIQYNLGNDDKAIEAYRKIANTTKENYVKKRALENIDQIISLK